MGRGVCSTQGKPILPTGILLPINYNAIVFYTGPGPSDSPAELGWNDPACEFRG
jgi:hypothetical protein